MSFSENIDVATVNDKTILWIGFASSLFCALLVLLWIAIGSVLHATEPKWPGQPIEVYGAAHWISNGFSASAGWLLIGAGLVTVLSIHHIVGRDRKRRSRIAIVFSVASALLLVADAIIHRVYLPFESRDPINYARAIMAAPAPIGWLLENPLALIGLAAPLFGTAFVLLGLAMRRDQLQGMARRFLIITGTIGILAGLSSPLGPWVMGLLWATMTLAFAASGAVLSVMFLRMQHTVLINPLTC